MQSDGCNMTLAAITLLTAFAMAFGCVLVDTSSVETTEQDLGQKWSYSVQFVFTGSNSESIEWDFGDGTTSTEWNPAHTYSEIGTYHVKQTVTNPNGSVETFYKVEVMGFPYVTLVHDNGSENGIIQQTAYNVAAEKPANPVKEGYDFTGWFTDEDCTQVYNWKTCITSPVTLYAGWEEVGSEPSGEEDQKDGGNDLYLYATIVCVVVAAMLVLAVILTGSVFIAVPAGIFGVASVVLGLLYGGLI